MELKTGLITKIELEIGNLKLVRLMSNIPLNDGIAHPTAKRWIVMLNGQVISKHFKKKKEAIDFMNEQSKKTE